jgi:hypothetical protein
MNSNAKLGISSGESAHGRVPNVMIWVLFLMAVGLFLVFVTSFAHQWYEKDSASDLGTILNQVAIDVTKESGKFSDAHLRIKEATIEVDLADEVAESADKSGKDIKVEGKGTNGHKLIIVLERMPDIPPANATPAPPLKVSEKSKQ